MSEVADRAAGPEWAERWQLSWDHLQAGLIRDREARLAALIDVAVGVVGSDGMVVDLACGTGTVTRRLLDRAPSMRSVAVDVDPVLLTIAAATFAEDDRVQILTADLRDQGGWRPRRGARSMRCSRQRRCTGCRRAP